jgi:hypothetical protein
MEKESKKMAIFSVRKEKGGKVWVRSGTAFTNTDGSLNLYLDVVPLDGRLHVREIAERRDFAPANVSFDQQPEEPAHAAGGY